VGVVPVEDLDEPVEPESLPSEEHEAPQVCEAKPSATISQTTFPIAINRKPRQIPPAMVRALICASLSILALARFLLWTRGYSCGYRAFPRLAF
jgi:hypothetical protein